MTTDDKNNALQGKTVLLIISGGIAAYKSLMVIRGLRQAGATVMPLLTKGGEQFVTPLSVASLAEHQVYNDLWSLKDEIEMGHIELSRQADLIVVAPASANLLAKMAHGLADDLASTTLLAANKPILIAPAMNTQMWQNPATQANIKTLQERGITQVGPNSGDLACGEVGAGRMSEPDEILTAIGDFFETTLNQDQPLSGKRAVVTSGPTHEAIDPVRYIGNRSSGRQGHAVAKSLAARGAQVTLVTGPVSLPDPDGINTIHITTADEMLKAVTDNGPYDIAVCAAAVSDWSPQTESEIKIKKTADQPPPTIAMKENPDILATIATGKDRPELVVGFALETDEDLIGMAQSKRERKGCDWILANRSTDDSRAFGTDNNTVHLIDTDGCQESWENLPKQEIAEKLCDRITEQMGLSAQPQTNVHPLKSA